MSFRRGRAALLRWGRRKKGKLRSSQVRLWLYVRDIMFFFRIHLCHDQFSIFLSMDRTFRKCAFRMGVPLASDQRGAVRRFPFTYFTFPFPTTAGGTHHIEVFLASWPLQLSPLFSLSLEKFTFQVQSRLSAIGYLLLAYVVFAFAFGGSSVFAACFVFCFTSFSVSGSSSSPMRLRRKSSSSGDGGGNRHTYYIHYNLLFFFFAAEIKSKQNSFVTPKQLPRYRGTARPPAATDNKSRVQCSPTYK